MFLSFEEFIFMNDLKNDSTSYTVYVYQQKNDIDYLTGLTKLEYLNLEGCALKSFSFGALRNSSVLSVLNLEGQMLHRLQDNIILPDYSSIRLLNLKRIDMLVSHEGKSHTVDDINNYSLFKQD